MIIVVLFMKLAKCDAINLLKYSLLNNREYIQKLIFNKVNIKNEVYKYYFDNLVKAKKIRNQKYLYR